jgi:hypothetical protein
VHGYQATDYKAYSNYQEGQTFNHSFTPQPPQQSKYEAMAIEVDREICQHEEIKPHASHFKDLLKLPLRQIWGHLISTKVA